jgi:hypothetical protein
LQPVVVELVVEAAAVMLAVAVELVALENIEPLFQDAMQYPL